MFNHESNAAVELKSPKVGLVRVADFGACSGQRRPTQRLHPKPINFRRRQLKDGGWESRREDPSCTRVSFGPSVPNTARCTNIGFTGIDMYNVIMKTEHLHQLIWMSRPLMQAAEACVESGLVGTNLTVRMRAVLEILDKYGEQSVPEIAARLEINRQYVQIMCKETLASGLIEQRANPRHKRSPILALTDHGRAVIQEIISEEMKLMEEVGVNLSNEDIATALKVVLAVVDSLKKRAGEQQ